MDHSMAPCGRRWESPPPVVRELTGLVGLYRRRRVDGATLLAWIEDDRTQDKLREAEDGPSRWLVPEIWTTLLAVRAGRTTDDEGRAAVRALLPEYRLRRDLVG